MNPSSIFMEFAKVSPLVLGMAIIIYALWSENKVLRSDYNSMREKMQDRIDVLAKQATDAINSSTNQSNGFSGALASTMTLITKQGDQWQDFKEDVMEALRNIK